ncbi:hypothetical protein [uncultured Rikenella sp.]|nr:hypothetical protein [uncultured Rikenella sp.]
MSISFGLKKSGAVFPVCFSGPFGVKNAWGQVLVLSFVIGVILKNGKRRK